MGREILFRGKRKENGKWVEGYYQQRYDAFENIQHLIFWAKSYTVWEYAEIEPETICQYTGLTDKNGRKIFEGDIVKINNDVKEAFEISDGAVIYRGGSFIVGNSSGNGTLNSLFAMTDINYVLRGEVIGNIFDNEELLNQ